MQVWTGKLSELQLPVQNPWMGKLSELQLPVQNPAARPPARLNRDDNIPPARRAEG